VALVVGVVTADTLTVQDASRPDFSGTWAVSRELSDKGASTSPDNSAREGGGRSRGGGGMRGAGGGRGGRGGGMSGKGGGDADMPGSEDTKRALDAATRTPMRLIIVTSDTGLIITDDEGVSTRIPLDGRTETGAANGVPFETTAKWEDRRLRVERKFKGGLKVVEYYSLSSDPHLLTVVSKPEGGRMPGGGRAATRVYEGQEAH
jgi:hypothetical protein